MQALWICKVRDGGRRRDDYLQCVLVSCPPKLRTLGIKTNSQYNLKQLVKQPATQSIRDQEHLGNTSKLIATHTVQG